MARDRDNSNQGSTSASSERTALLHDHHPEQSPSLDSHPAPTGYWPWRPHYLAVLPVIFLTGLSMGPAVALHAPLVKELFCERGIPKYFPGNFSSDERAGYGHHALFGPGEADRCDSAEYSAAIAKFVGIQASLAAVFVTLTVRFWAMLSDRIGRKRSMQLWATGMCLGQSLPIVVYYGKDLSLYLLWVGGLIEGSVGAVLCVIALTHSYVADITRHEQRVVVFGRVMAAYYAGLGLG
jgi:MFS family permease